MRTCAVIGLAGPAAIADRAATIWAINGKAVSSTEQFIATVDTYSPGQTITLAIKRGGKAQNVQLKLGTRPASPTSG